MLTGRLRPSRGEGQAASETVKFNCKVRTLEDKHGIAEFKGCKKSGKYQVSIRTKDTKLDGWPSRAWIDRDGIKVVSAVADGKGRRSPWMTTGWTTNAGPTRLTRDRVGRRRGGRVREARPAPHGRMRVRGRGGAGGTGVSPRPASRPRTRRAVPRPGAVPQDVVAAPRIPASHPGMRRPAVAPHPGLWPNAPASARFWRTRVELGHHLPVRRARPEPVRHLSCHVQGGNSW